MTDAQVEQVAREWCRIAGIDPDAQPKQGDVWPLGVPVPYDFTDSPRPFWKYVQFAVRDRARMDRAFGVLAP